MTVHFGERPFYFGQTVHFRGTVHFDSLMQPTVDLTPHTDHLEFTFFENCSGLSSTGSRLKIIDELSKKKLFGKVKSFI